VREGDGREQGEYVDGCDRDAVNEQVSPEELVGQGRALRALPDVATLSRRRFLRAGAGAAVAGLGSVALVACGDDDDDTAGTGGDTTTGTGTPTSQGGDTSPTVAATNPTGAAAVTTEPPVVADADPVPGGRLIYGLEGENSQGFNPTTARFALPGIMIGRAIFDPLMLPDDTGAIQPFLAESVVPNADFTEWVITLRPGISFHDGTPLDSAAVKANLDGHLASFLTRQALLPVASVDIVDDLTTSVKMSTPWAVFDRLLGGQIGFVAAPAMLADVDNGGANPVGTGPFIFKEWQLDSHLIATRNPSYWRQGLPYLEEIEFRPIIDISTRTAALRAGDIDLYHTNNPGEIVEFRDDDNFQIAESDAYAETNFVMLNTAIAPFDDVTVRQALAFATDVEEFNTIRNQGIVAASNGPFSPGQLGFLTDNGYPKFDLDRAKELLAGRTISFTLASVPDTFNVENNNLLKAQWARAGFEVELATFEQAALINNSLVGDFQANYFRNYGGLDPDNYYHFLIGANAGDIGAIALNFGRWKNAEWDDLMNRGRATGDAAERKEIYEAANRVHAADVPNVYIFFTRWAVIAKNDVADIVKYELPDGGRNLPLEIGRHQVSQLWVNPNA
jgi:peptide/nickel transport system substrate-binding protein